MELALIIRPYRITPAYAGQIRLPASFAMRTRDHPRIRGTNCEFPKSNVNKPGSPPHTRGKFGIRSARLLSHRITPAYAGQISCRSSNSMYWRDHPRIRGTNPNTSPERFSCAGSSPHTRDKCR